MDAVQLPLTEFTDYLLASTLYQEVILVKFMDVYVCLKGPMQYKGPNKGLSVGTFILLS